MEWIEDFFGSVVTVIIGLAVAFGAWVLATGKTFSQGLESLRSIFGSLVASGQAKVNDVGTAISGFWKDNIQPKLTNLQIQIGGATPNMDEIRAQLTPNTARIDEELKFPNIPENVKKELTAALGDIGDARITSLDKIKDALGHLATAGTMLSTPAPAK